MARIVVCGGRDFNDRELCFQALDKIIPMYPDPEIVSGHATGADSLGEEYAREHALPVSIFPASWQVYGRAAGPIRNKQMLEYARQDNPLIVAFWDGASRGTGNMIRQAKEAGVPVKIIRIGKETNSEYGH